MEMNASDEKIAELRGRIDEIDRQLVRLFEERLDIAREMLSGIRAGRIEARPLEKVCDYCDYGSICRFDSFLPGCRVRRKRRATQAAFFGAEGGDGA